MTVILLPFDSPPLRSNHRLSHYPKAKLVREIRQAARLAAQGVEPIAGRVSVRLVWTVPDKRIRDVGAAAPTLKAALDGIVDAGVLRGDDSRYVDEERCRIEPIKGVRGVRIEIEEAA